MFCRHKHNWEEVKRSYTAPLARSLKASWLSEDMMLRFTMGVTVIELKCVECGDIKHKEVIGEI